MGRRKVSGRLQDVTGKWRSKVGKLADALGWVRPRLYGHWSQIALEVEYQYRAIGIDITRSLAEHEAFQILVACVTKREGEPS